MIEYQNLKTGDIISFPHENVCLINLVLPFFFFLLLSLNFNWDWSAFKVRDHTQILLQLYIIFHGAALIWLIRKLQNYATGTRCLLLQNTPHFNRGNLSLKNTNETTYRSKICQVMCIYHRNINVFRIGNLSHYLYNISMKANLVI